MLLKCPYCQRVWTPKSIIPKSCPDCHRYFRVRMPEEVKASATLPIRNPGLEK